MVLGELDHYMQKKKKIKLDHQLTPHTRINSRWIENVNIGCDTIKLSEKNIGSEISGVSYSNIFDKISPRVRKIKEKINK